MRSFALLILLLCASFLHAQKPDRAAFKNGTFLLVDKEHGNAIIERKGSKQIEYGEGSRLKVSFKVRWVDACTYTLEVKKVLENPKEIPLPDGMILTVRILETTENSYRQRSTSNLYDLVLESEMVRVK